MKACGAHACPGTYLAYCVIEAFVADGLMTS